MNLKYISIPEKTKKCKTWDDEFTKNMSHIYCSECRDKLAIPTWDKRLSIFRGNIRLFLCETCYESLKQASNLSIGYEW